MNYSRLPLLASLGLAVLIPASCQSTSESAGANQLTANVGRYDAPPPGLVPPRLGVPKVTVSGDNSAGMEKLAADQLTTLMTNTDRFMVIERAQLDKLLDEQNMEGIVREDERSQAGQVRGVDFLMTAAITNFRTKATRTGSNFGIGNITRSIGIGMDMDKSAIEIKTECGVDIRVVDATTGAVLVADQSEFTRSDNASSMGLQILGVGGSSEADIEIDQDDRGLILRLALDDAVKRMLPALDRKLMARSREMKSAAAASATLDDVTNGTETTPSMASLFCSDCGGKVKSGAKFCPGCGAKVTG